MRITFVEPSDQELEDAIDYYEDQLLGLGRVFYDEVMDCINLIEMFPHFWRKVGRKTRRCLLKRFPFMVLYIAEDDEVIITAIGHQHRDPEYYSDRII